MKIALFGSGGKGWMDYVQSAIQDMDIDAEFFSPTRPADADQNAWDEWEKTLRPVEEAAKVSADVLVVGIIPPMTALGMFEAAQAAIEPTLRNKLLLCIVDEFDGNAFTERELCELEAVWTVAAKYGAEMCEELDDITTKVLQRHVEIENANKPDAYHFNPNILECLIDREGSTPIMLNKRQYIFERNSRGHAVCFIPNAGAISHLLSTGSYRYYCPDDCVITPEQKRLYGISLNDKESESFWKDFVNSFIRLKAEDFCGYSDVVVSEQANSNSRRARMPDKMRFVDGFVQRNLKTIDSSPEWVRNKVISKWNRGCDKMQVSMAYPGRR